LTKSDYAKTNVRLPNIFVGGAGQLRKFARASKNAAAKPKTQQRISSRFTRNNALASFQNAELELFAKNA